MDTFWTPERHQNNDGLPLRRRENFGIFQPFFAFLPITLFIGNLIERIVFYGIIIPKRGEK
jgi:ammonia channel protein AmtB